MSTPDESELCYPHLGNLSCRRIIHSRLVSVTFYITLSSISVLTVGLNLLVIISISHFKKLHTPTNFLLLSLAVSDFSVGFLIFFQIYIIEGCWYFGAGLCAFHTILSYIISSASIGTVVLISVDRYVAVCDPMHYSTKMTPKRAKISVSICWASCGIGYTVMFKDNIEYAGQFVSCLGECFVYNNPLSGLMYIVLNFFGPISIIVILYMRVFVVAVSQARAMRSQVTVVTLQRSQKVSRSELKAARALGVVVVVFLICLTPSFVYSFLSGFSGLNAFSGILIICLYYFNSLLNPVIYAFLYPWFRKCIKCILSLQILESGSSDYNFL